MKKIALVFALLSGCATGYVPMGNTGGYEEQRVGENAYVVSFNGNGFTDAKRARDFALMRAAEIGAKLKFTHFVIQGTQDASSTSTTYLPSTSTTTGAVYGNTYSSTTTNSVNAIPVYRPGVVLGVQYFDGPPQGRYLEIYETQETLTALKTKYRIK